MTTKKKSYAARLGVLALALTLMTTCLLGGTMAKYTTTVQGTGSATVAKWDFKANGEPSTFDVTLADTMGGNVAPGKIAPGAKGSFTVVASATNSEVAVDYTIALSDIPVGLNFYSDTDHKQPIKVVNGIANLSGKIALDGNKEVTETVYWAWPGTTNDEDTAAGVSGKDMTFKITVTGTQSTTAVTPGS